jgi:predicted methyltransferase
LPTGRNLGIKESFLFKFCIFAIPMVSVNDISEYIVALIAAFASHYNMTDVEAYKYLNKYGAIKVAHDFYDVMHTQPMDDMVQSMSSYCKRKGGSL